MLNLSVEDMNGKSTNLRFSLVLAFGLFLTAGLAGPIAQTREKANATMRQPTAYDRIQRAADMGELTLKEAVLLKAKLLFSPSLIPRDSKYAPKPNEAKVQEDCLTGFYKEVHQVFPQLGEEEKAFLKSLSPDLDAIISQKEREEKAKK
jgi:hypothetical protein